jgi:hypothetical protein
VTERLPDESMRTAYRETVVPRLRDRVDASEAAQRLAATELREATAAFEVAESAFAVARDRQKSAWATAVCARHDVDDALRALRHAEGVLASLDAAATRRSSAAARARRSRVEPRTFSE